MSFQLSQIKSAIATGIVKSMEKRETQLLGNGILLASIFVDPKNRLLLKDDQLKQSKEVLLELAMKIRGITALEKTDCVESVEEERDLPGSTTETEDFNKYLDRLAAEKRRKISTDREDSVKSPSDEFKREFREKLKEIEKYDRFCQIPLEDLIQLYPEVTRDGVKIAMALPSTQVSVERLFSVLKLMKSDLRDSLKEDVAEAILFLRSFD